MCYRNTGTELPGAKLRLLCPCAGDNLPLMYVVKKKQKTVRDIEITSRKNYLENGYGFSNNTKNAPTF